jgi:Immune inhibitor A peptidase M6/Putative Ig domain
VVAYIRNTIWVWLLLAVVCNVGCTCAQGEAPVSTTGSSSASSSSGTGGSDLGPCGVDCSAFETLPCTTAVCNTGQLVGQLNTCVVVPSPTGTACDDGQFCTVNDTCDNGTCSGGTPNRCGLTVSPCSAVICYEDSKSCDVTPVDDGAACTPTNLCQVNGVCHIGDCVGETKDCTFSPLNECNKVACEPTTGKCVATVDPDKQDASCLLTGDLCSVSKTCSAGQCGGGKPKDCSAFNVGCQVGVCDAANGFCGPATAPIGTACTEGIPECHVGACDDKGTCASSSAPDGTACNDHNSCTQADTCAAGACAGGAVAGCLLYLQEGFELCPSGWTFGGDWQCGKPSNVGPLKAHTGNGVIATKIAGLYSVNQSFTTTVADSPPIDLTLATNPVVSFWAWVQTEGGTFDGWNMKVSTNGGQSFTDVTTVTPAYDLTITGKPAWGGDHSADGWQNYRADLTAFIGKPIILRFAFRSDGATVFPGVYIDDIVVAEPQKDPLFITTPSPLMDVYAKMAYTATITKTGGTSSAVWSIKPGGVNAAWLSIDPATGVLSGTPSAMETGPVSVTVHVEEPMLPSNFAEKTFTFKVNQAAYYTSFEACPDGWTLTGDWQCGVPTVVGPATAYVGTQCIATQIAGSYHDLQTWAGTTATSPDIDLTGLGSPILTFRMWVDTEGSTYDGANLQISTDSGMNYTILTSVKPAYPLTVAGKPAWGGHQSALGWQDVQADLSAYVGQTIRLQFTFQSDSSGTYPGVYIDDILVN